MRLVIIGGGNMARAIVRGGIDAGVLSPEAVIVCEPDAQKHGPFEAMGARATVSHADALGDLGDGQVLLAVKPQMLGAVGEQVRGSLAGRGVVVISILAGTPSAKVRDALGEGVRVVRAMPNLAASLRRSTTALCLGAGAKEGDDAFAARLFTGIGPVVERIDESLMDAFTAVAGSGPAYVFYLAEAMAEAAVELGFEADVAERIVRETVAGAGLLLGGSTESAAVLRGAVTSKGGTTAAAIASLEASGVRERVRDALRAARDRGAELGRGG